MTEFIYLDLFAEPVGQLLRKIWIQRDGTERGIARELIREGIPPERVVLAFRPSGARPYSEFQAA
ncbi:element excision factor XisI family protein [Sorangium sp. So ce119]|uniref:element excision factor XisI family protein n=1 Tax=Sorangium sp. So ce119 TaxID=3133279 RepID=UPI003F6287F5